MSRRYDYHDNERDRGRVRDKRRDRDHQDRYSRERDYERSRESRHRDRRDDRYSKKDRYRHRSRSRSPARGRRYRDKSRSPSRENYGRRRSRSPRRREDRKPKEDRGFRFDSPPKDHEIPKISAMDPTQMAAGLGLSNSQIGQQNILQSIQAMSMAQTAKIDRKLYVGNLPPGITQQTLLKIVNEALMSLNIIKEPGNPVVSTWISTDTHYAFIEFRNSEEANLGFRLHGMSIGGSEIKIGRPKAYEGTMQAIGLPAGMSIQNKDFMTGCDNQDILEQEKIARAMERFKPRRFNQVFLPSNILRLDNIATFESTQDTDDFKNLYSDIWDKCSEYGQVAQILIPRPIFEDHTEENREKDLEKLRIEAEEEEKRAAADPKFVKKSERRKARLRNKENKENLADFNELHPLQDIRNYRWHPQYFGSAFVRFETIEGALQARRGIHLLKYGTGAKNQQMNTIECSFVSEPMLNIVIQECNQLAQKGKEKEEVKEEAKEETAKKEDLTAKYGILKRKELDALFQGFEGDLSSEDEPFKQVKEDVGKGENDL